MNRDTNVNRIYPIAIHGFASAVIASNPTRTRQRTIIGEAHCETLRFLYLAIESCAEFSDSVEKNLGVGSYTRAGSVFRHAEEAFEEAHQYLEQIAREDWRRELEPILEDLALRLDHSWVKLMSANAIN